MKKQSILFLFCLGAMTQAQTKVIEVRGNNSVREFSCNNQSVLIQGDNHVVDISGNCSKVTVEGTSNVVQIARVNRLQVYGDYNVVSYENPTSERKISITDKGRDNVIGRK